MKYAFTLAEALIVLGIVAILATLSTLAVTNVKPDEDVIMFRKAYRTISSAIEQIKKNKDLFYENCETNQVSQLANICKIQANDSLNDAYNFINTFSKLIGAVNSNIQTNVTEIEEGIFGNEYHNNAFSTADGIYWEISNTYGGPNYELYVYPDGVNSKSKACSYDSSSCPRPNKFYFTIDVNTAEISMPISYTDSNYNPVACTYLRYPRINKFNKFPTKAEGNTCYP